MGVEAWTLQQKVFNSLGDVPAPGAVRIRGQTKTVQVSCECRVPQAEAGEGDIQDTGFLSYPRLEGGVTSVMAHEGLCNLASVLFSKGKEMSTSVSCHHLAASVLGKQSLCYARHSGSVPGKVSERCQ